MVRGLWWLCWLGILVAAAACFAFAIYIEMQVRLEVEDWGWGLSYATYDDYIYAWKRWVAWLSLGGAGLLFIGYLLRPWGRRHDCEGGSAP